jgi:YYY domain-containing protein
MIDFAIWYLLITAFGLLAFPIAFRLLRWLPDRGWSFSKPLGLLISGYAFWILTTLQINQNDTGGVLVGVAVLAGVGIWLGFRSGWKNIWSWIKEHQLNLIVTEVLFLVAFGVWAMVRATGPEMASTEKPMEMAFINAILRSPSFPPSDPWLSGYSISYYYFGYVLVSMIIRLAGTVPNIGFNLAVAMWFALAATASYGLLFNLTSGWLGRTGRNIKKAVWNGLLAPFLLLIVANLEGIFEVLHSRGIFWQLNPDGTGTSAFWRWLGLLELVNPPTLPLGWNPERVSGIWWWRASRVVTDTNLAGAVTENIDEFPFFSFYLGDLHPHVLAIPFALLAVGVIMNFFLSDGQSIMPGRKVKSWLQSPGFWLAVVSIGALGFLNTWDFPMYVALASAAYTLLQFGKFGWSGERIWEFIKFGLCLGIGGGLLYLPFYLGFRSQAGGVLPSLSLFSRGIHFWIMFGGLLIPILAWLIWRWKNETSGLQRKKGFFVALWILAGVFTASYVLSLLILAAPGLIESLNLQSNPLFSEAAQKLMQNAGQFYNLHGSTDVGQLIFGSIGMRLKYPGTWITLLGLLGLTWGLLSIKKMQPKPVGINHVETYLKPDGVNILSQDATIQNRAAVEEETENIIQVDQPEFSFNLLLILVGLGLTLAPEFFYLLDQFGYRMNTIFKFYYQGWEMWSLAASFALVVLWNQRGKVGFMIFKCLSLVVIGIGLIYPIYALYQRFDQPLSNWSLDGLTFTQTYKPDEYKAIEFLRTAEFGVVAEAVGGQYSEFARIATHTGLPTVIGWPGHESQWGRTGEQLGARAGDIERLYTTKSWDEAKAILDLYHIRYIYVGQLERAKYPVDETKFSSMLRIAFQSDSVVIYEYEPIR